MSGKKYKYKVETHLHASQASACARNTGAEMARGCKDAGYCAIFVTDHFFNGNSSLRGGKYENYSWDDKITLFMKGYEDAKKEGGKIGLDVYFGFEYNYNGAEFLIYNYGEEQLRCYPGIMTDDMEKVFANIKKAGGFIIHAHPFRTAPYILNPGKLFSEYVDAVEIINPCNYPNKANQLAAEYAEKYNLIKFGGSDTHSADYHEGGMAFPRKPESVEDIIETARSGDCVILGEEYLR